MGLDEGNLDVTLPCHLGSIGDAGADVGLLDPGIIIQKLFGRRACSEEIEDQGHPETVSFDAGLAKTNRGINGNPREQLFPGHGRLPHVILPWKVRRRCQASPSSRLLASDPAVFATPPHTCLLYTSPS